MRNNPVGRVDPSGHWDFSKQSDRADARAALGAGYVVDATSVYDRRGGTIYDSAGNVSKQTGRTNTQYIPMNNPDAVVRGLGDPPPLAIVALDQIVTEGPGVITRPQIDPGLWVKSGQALLDALAAAILASGSLPHPSDPNNREDPSLYRSMRAADIGLMPAVGPTGRTLGARVPLDIPVDADGMVSPGTGGMSVAPFSPANLPSHRRPSSLPGGTSKDPVWRFS